MSQGTVCVLQGGDVMAEWGPMSLIVSAFAGKVPQPDMSENAGRYAFTVLEKISRLRKALSRPWKQVPDTLREPAAFKMLQSVMAVGDPDLTPMAAVAGAIADAVADYLAGRGMTKVIVNNGGDIAIRLMGRCSRHGRGQRQFCKGYGGGPGGCRESGAGYRYPRDSGHLSGRAVARGDPIPGSGTGPEQGEKPHGEWGYPGCLCQCCRPKQYD